MNIKTTQKSNASGATKITARAAGKQKTVTYDHSRSNAANHGIAAGALIIDMHRKAPLTTNPPSEFVRSLDAGYGTHESNESGTAHTFEV